MGNAPAGDEEIAEVDVNGFFNGNAMVKSEDILDLDDFGELDDPADDADLVDWLAKFAVQRSMDAVFTLDQLFSNTDQVKQICVSLKHTIFHCFFYKFFWEGINFVFPIESFDHSTGVPFIPFHFPFHLWSMWWN